MAKRKPAPKTDVSPRAPLTPEMREAYVTLVETVFYNIFEGLLKTNPHEEEYGDFGEDIRRLIRKNQRLIARYAAEYFVDAAGANIGNLPEKRALPLQRSSVRKAVKRLTDEETRHV